MTTECAIVSEGRRRKYYSVTDSGRGLLADQRRQWETVPASLKTSRPGSRCTETAQANSGWRAWSHRSQSGSLRRERARRQRPRRRRARGSSSPPDRRAERGRPHGRRGVLVAVKRMGDVDALSREFARRAQRPAVDSFVLSGEDEPARSAGGWVEPLVSPSPRCRRSRSHASPRISPTRSRPGRPERQLVVLPSSPGYFAHRRQLDLQRCCADGGAVRARRARVNLYPWDAARRPRILRRDSLCRSRCGSRSPIRVWSRRSVARGRMDFVHFTGEWSYYVLIALGGGVLMGLTAAILEPTGGRRRHGRRVGAAVGSGGRRHRRCVARRVERASRGEHGAGAHDALHAAVRGHARSRRRRLRGDRARRRLRPRPRQRLRRPAGGRPRARPVRDVRAGPSGRRRAGWTASSSSPWSAPSCST